MGVRAPSPRRRRRQALRRRRAAFQADQHVRRAGPGGRCCRPARAHHHVGAPVAVDVPAPAAAAGVVERRRAVDAEARAPSAARSISGSLAVRRRRAPSRSRCGRCCRPAPPTTTSARPSPFTSPAPATAAPALSSAAAPSMRKPAPRAPPGRWRRPGPCRRRRAPSRWSGVDLRRAPPPGRRARRRRPRAGDRRAGVVERRRAVDAKPAPERPQVDLRGLSPPNTTCAEPEPGAVAAGLRRPHHHVGAPVAVHVPRAGHAAPALSSAAAPSMRKPAPRAPPGRWRRPGPCRRRRAPSPSRGGRCCRPAARPPPRRRARRRSRPRRRPPRRRCRAPPRRRCETRPPSARSTAPDVSRRPNTTKAASRPARARRPPVHRARRRRPVAVDVAAPDGRPEPVAVGRAVDAKPARADLGEVDRRRRLGAEDHIGRSRAAAAPRGLLRGADDHIAAPVAVVPPRRPRRRPSAAADRAIDTKVHVRREIGTTCLLPEAAGLASISRAGEQRQSPGRSGRRAGPRRVRAPEWLGSRTISSLDQTAADRKAPGSSNVSARPPTAAAVERGVSAVVTRVTNAPSHAGRRCAGWPRSRPCERPRSEARRRGRLDASAQPAAVGDGDHPGHAGEDVARAPPAARRPCGHDGDRCGRSLAAAPR